MRWHCLQSYTIFFNPVTLLSFPHCPQHSSPYSDSLCIPVLRSADMLSGL